MTQEIQDPEMQGAKPISAVAIAVGIVAVVVVVVGGYMVFDWMSRGAFEVRGNGPTTASAAAPAPVEKDAGPAPTIRAGALTSVPPGMVKSDGGFRFEMAGLQFLVMHFDERWAGVDQNHGVTPTGGAPESEKGLLDMQAQWNVNGGQFDCHQTLRRAGPNEFSYDTTLKSDAGVQTALLCMEIHLPVDDYAGEKVVVDGVAVKIPETFTIQGVYDNPSFKKLQIMTTVGRLVIEGSGPLWIQDNRQYGASVFTIRFPFRPHNGLLTQTELQMKMTVVP